MIFYDINAWPLSVYAIVHRSHTHTRTHAGESIHIECMITTSELCLNASEALFACSLLLALSRLQHEHIGWHISHFGV